MTTGQSLFKAQGEKKFDFHIIFRREIAASYVNCPPETAVLRDKVPTKHLN